MSNWKYVEPKIKYSKTNFCPLCNKKVEVKRETVLDMIRREFRTMFVRCVKCDQIIIYNLKTGEWEK